MPLKHCCDHLRERKRERGRGGEEEEEKKKMWEVNTITYKNLYGTFFGRGPRTSHALKSYLERTIKLFLFLSSHRFSDVIPRFSRVRRSESSSVNPLVVGKRVLKSSGASSASQDAGWILSRAAAGTLWASLQTSWSGCMRRLSWSNTPLKLEKKTTSQKPEINSRLCFSLIN